MAKGVVACTCILKCVYSVNDMNHLGSSIVCVNLNVSGVNLFFVMALVLPCLMFFLFMCF